MAGKYFSFSLQQVIEERERGASTFNYRTRPKYSFPKPVLILKTNNLLSFLKETLIQNVKRAVLLVL
jgi:hypothetical protein